MTDDIVARLRSPEVFIDTGGMFSPVTHEAVMSDSEECKLLTAQNDRLWRALRDTHGPVANMIAQARADAIEEAAAITEAHKGWLNVGQIADAIRALATVTIEKKP